MNFASPHHPNIAKMYLLRPMQIRNYHQLIENNVLLCYARYELLYQS
jgi:hypothetical protein